MSGKITWGYLKLQGVDEDGNIISAWYRPEVVTLARLAHEIESVRHLETLVTLAQLTEAFQTNSRLVIDTIVRQELIETDPTERRKEHYHAALAISERNDALLAENGELRDARH